MTTPSQETTLRIRIDSLTHGPCGIGRERGWAIFVPFTAPGDEAVITLTGSRGRYARGELVSLTQASHLRQTPPCRYFGQCGGCSWQHVQYRTQLNAKGKNLLQTIRRIGKLDDFSMEEIVPSSRDYGYRRRIRLHVNQNKRIGFFRTQSHDLIEVDSCLIADPRVNAILGSLPDWVRQMRTTIRDIEIVAGDQGTSVVILADCIGAFIPADDSLCSGLLKSNPSLNGLVLLEKFWRKVWGQTKIQLSVDENSQIEVDVDGFVQVNRDSSCELALELLDWGKFSPRDRVLELYAGSGNLTFPLARRSAEVVAVEANQRSVKNGKANSRRLALKNIHWVHSQVSDEVQALGVRGESFTKIVLNPPRSGAKGLAPHLVRLKAGKIFYISCDPPTLARDLAALSQVGYRLKRVRPFDLFPQTYHVETLAELIRISG